MHFHASNGPPLVDFYLIHEAPTPILTRLKRFHNRVLRLVEMCRCMLVLGLIAAAHMAALHTKPQMHPEIPNFEAVLTPICACFHLVYPIQVRAAIVIGHIVHVLDPACVPFYGEL